jgi:hypothetical protein
LFIGFISFLERQRRVRYRYANDISEAIATQGWILLETVCRHEERGRTHLMSQENSDVKVDEIADRPVQGNAPTDSDRAKRLRLWVNWALALLTVVGAGVVMVVALGAVMSTAACSDKACPNIGPAGISFNTLFYGAPAMAALTIVASFFTAKRRWGFVIPVSALALLIADIAILAVTVAQ